jgi:uncharacterized protein YkvS
MKLTASEHIFLNVAPKDTIVDFGEGITSKITEKISANTLQVQITIAANATIGTRTVHVTTSTSINCAEATFIVTIGPSMVINPPFGEQGELLKDLTITGQNTHFASGKTTVSFGPNTEMQKKTVDNDAQTMIITVQIGPNAQPGVRTVTATTPLGNNMKEVVTGDFTVLPAATQ